MGVPAPKTFPVAQDAASFGTFWGLPGRIYPLFAAKCEADHLLRPRPGTHIGRQRKQPHPGGAEAPADSTKRQSRSGRARPAPWTPRSGP